MTKKVGETMKISTKWSPGQSQMEPERRKNNAKITKKCSLAPKMLPGWFQEGSQPEGLAPNHRFLGPLGDPKSTENRPVDLQSAAGLVF